MALTAAEEMRDGDENHGAEGGSRERIPEASSEDSKLGKNPAADEGANDSKNNVGDAAKAAPARDFSRKPSRDQADQQPANDPAAVLEVKDMFIEENGAQSWKHFTSCTSWNTNQNRLTGKPLHFYLLIP